jgi:hypothetical protein
VEAAEAMSGSDNAVVPNKIFNAIDVFIDCFLCCLNRLPGAGF